MLIIEVIMLNDGEFQELVEALHSKQLSIRVATLKTLQKHPSSDERVLQHIEALLNDKTPCVLMLPYRFGEIRWLAAQALAAERASLGNEEPVRLQNVVRPLDTEEFVGLREKAGVKSRGGVDGVLEALATLREMGQLPLYDLELLPKIKKLA
ncbi:MAG TPA: hypothetical protein V6D11_21680 [Waterburya sp.]|jgi:hypothetical protein